MVRTLAARTLTSAWCASAQTSGPGASPESPTTAAQLSVAKDGNITRTLWDTVGLHPIEIPAVANGALTFTVKYHPWGADVPFTYSVILDAIDLSVGVDKPDFSPVDRAGGRTGHHDFKAKHE